MKLLFDQNLSFKLVRRVKAVLPQAKHVKDFELAENDDEAIWNFAAENAFAIVSKDADFLHRALLRGHPPKVIYLRVGNCSATEITGLLLANAETIKEFLADPDESVFLI